LPPSPPQRTAPPTPPDAGLRFHDDERRSPSSPKTRQHDPQPTVRLLDPQSPRPVPLQPVQLVAYRKHFELERSARTRSCSQGQNEDSSTDMIDQKHPSSAVTSTTATRTAFPVGTGLTRLGFALIM